VRHRENYIEGNWKLFFKCCSGNYVRLRFARHATRAAETRNVYIILVGKPFGKWSPENRKADETKGLHWLRIGPSVSVFKFRLYATELSSSSKLQNTLNTYL